MKQEYHVGITYSPNVVDECGLKDKAVFDELSLLGEKHRKVCVARGHFPGIEAHEAFSFFDLESALGFMADTFDKPYVISEMLIREDNYKEIFRALQEVSRK